jgi:Cyclic phosphodiesterase-like protein
LPHLTLTSGIPDSVTDSESIIRQEWLESLSVSLSAPPIVRFESLDVGERITRKLTIRVAKELTLVDLAIQLRAMAVEGGSREAAEKWVKTTWAPHISLLYADTNIGEEKRLEVIKTVSENGIRIEANGEVPMEPACDGWEGGKIVWADTRGEIGGWRILGTRDLEVDAI